MPLPVMVAAGSVLSTHDVGRLLRAQRAARATRIQNSQSSFARNEDSKPPSRRASAVSTSAASTGITFSNSSSHRVIGRGANTSSRLSGPSA